MRVCFVSFARPSGFDPWPSSRAVARAVWRVATTVTIACAVAFLVSMVTCQAVP